MPSVVTRRRRTQNAQNDILNMESGAQPTASSQQDLSRTDAFVTKYSGYAGIPILLGVLGLYILYRAMSTYLFTTVIHGRSLLCCLSDEL